MSNHIPSEEEFARASAALKRRSRGLSELRDRILARFQRSGEIYEFFIFDCSEYSFRAYVFYLLDGQIEEAERSGLASQIKDAVFDELKNVGRSESSTIEFEFDSHENVERSYEGNYYNRLR